MRWLGGAAALATMAMGSAAWAEPGQVCVDMLALGEPVCDIASSEIEVGAHTVFTPDAAGSLLENTLELAVGLTEFVALSVRMDSALPLSGPSASPEATGVGAHSFIILAQSEAHDRGLGLGVDLSKAQDGGPAAELALSAAFIGPRLSLYIGAGGVAGFEEDATPLDAFAGASFAVRLGEVAALVEARVEGGASPLALSLAPGFTWHPTERTKLLMSAPVCHVEGHWGAAVQLSFAANWALGSDPESVAAAVEP